MNITGERKLTEQSIRTGVVAMELHPDYQKVMERVEARGFYIRESKSHPRVQIRRDIFVDGQVLDTRCLWVCQRNALSRS